jgi:ABC-type Mn2+/Zn2+ transport system permease subunit
MHLGEWSKANADYGRKLFNSGLEGARSGREAFLHGGSLAPFLGESARSALKPAAFGVCLGVLGSLPGNRHKSASKAIAGGLVGGALGFGIGVAWQSRHLVATVASGVFGNIGRVRDEHWLEKNPIDYA